MLVCLGKGILIGLSIAAPVGPIAVYCIRQTLLHGRIFGVVSGFGAATADMLYGLIAAFGMIQITAMFTELRVWFRLLGGLFLLYLAAKTYFSATDAAENKLASPQKLIDTYFTVFFLTITNPMTVMMFLAIFTGISSGTGIEQFTANILVVIGVFIGSALWWIFLSLLIEQAGKKINASWQRSINIISASIIGGFGLFTLFKL